MHFYVIKSRLIFFLAIIFSVMAVLSVDWAGQGCLASVFFYKNNRKIPIYCVDTTEKNIAITFDAAWGSDKTEDILNTLKEHDVKATFFLVGMWVDKYPEMVKKIDEYGIEIGTHSNLHPDMSKLSEKQVNLELSSSVSKIESITGKKVEFFRAPYGAYNNQLLTCTENMNIKTIQWDVDTLDWKGITAQQICSNVFKKTKPGSIILCHNNSDHIVEALPTIITNLKARGYNFVTVGELVYKTDFYVDSSGKQIKK